MAHEVSSSTQFTRLTMLGSVLISYNKLHSLLPDGKN